jgi:hypothetical protein
MTIKMIISPGKTVIQGASKRKERPELMIEPQLGKGGCIPSPKKLSVASTIMAFGTSSVVKTTKGAREFGKMWRNIILRSEYPRILAASMNSWLFRDRN